MNYQKEADKLFNGVVLAPSIDNYLHAHAENDFRVRLGKMLIADSISQAEKSSKLFFDPTNIYHTFDFSRTVDTWLHTLFRILVTAGNFESFRSRMSRITFICFNYDRVIERFFFLAVQSLFDLSEEKATEFCRNDLDVIHPYGVISKLDYSNRASGFGEMREHQSYIDGESSLRTFTERASTGLQHEIQERLKETSTLFILGFSYLSLNMDLLNPGPICNFVHVVGTRRGVSDYNIKVAEERLNTWTEYGLRGTDFLQSTCSDALYSFSELILAN